MTLSPVKSSAVSSAEEFLCEIEPSIMQRRDLIGLEQMEGIEDETSHWSDAFDTDKGIVFTDLSLTIRIERDLPALNTLDQPRPAQLCMKKVKVGLQKLWESTKAPTLKIQKLVMKLCQFLTKNYETLCYFDLKLCLSYAIKLTIFKNILNI